MATLGAGEATGGEPDAAALAARWARTIAGTSYVPMELPEIEAYLLTHAQRIVAVWRGEPFDPDQARPVGAALVDGHFTHSDTIARTVALLSETFTSGDGVRELSKVGAQSAEREAELLCRAKMWEAEANRAFVFGSRASVN